MPSSFGVVGRDPGILINQINLNMNQELAKLNPAYEKIAFVDRTSGKTGEVEYYPMQVSSTAEVDRGPTEERQFSDAEVIELECKANRVEQKNGVLIPMGPEYDPYGLIEQKAPDLIRQISKIWDRRLASLIRANKVAYDGAPFFGDHSSNKAKLGASLFNNDLKGISTTEAGIQYALDYFTHIPGFDGTFINDSMGTPLFLCPTLETKIPLDKLFHEGLIAEQVASAAASSNTRMVGLGQTLWMPELYDPTDPSSKNSFYIINMNYGDRAAFIVRNPVTPQILMSSGDSNDYFYMTRNARAITYVTHGGVGYGLPQLCLRCSL